LSKEYKRNYDPEHNEQIKKLLSLDNEKKKINQLIFKKQNEQFFLAKDSRKKFKKKRGIRLKKRDHNVFNMLKNAHQNPKLTSIFPKKVLNQDNDNQ
jgi:hypothetical protein